jgi:cysteine desulfurase family protein (TIGR01976 family)
VNTDGPTIDPSRIRSVFPALRSDLIFLENAGGSQVPAMVAQAIQRYLTESYVQLGAGYALSQRCTQMVDDAHAFVRMFMNGTAGHVILGSSTTALLHVLAACYGSVLEPDREIVVAESGHEANIGPWVGLERRGARIRWWRIDPESLTCPMEGLERLLSPRTALVAFPHVSNLLGEVVDVKAVTKRVHDAGARVVVDGVAYAPHRAIDVEDWDVDWYAYSTYKVYGPHMAALYGRADAVAELTGPNHFFIGRDAVPYKFELGGPSHEGCAGLLALGGYLALLAGADTSAPCQRDTVCRAYDVMHGCELPAQTRLVEFLRSKPRVRIVGPADAGAGRVFTVSFVHAERSSREITAAVDRSGIAIRHGHMYAYRLCQALGLDPEDGVVRVSGVHYNTVEEIDRLIGVLDPLL